MAELNLLYVTVKHGSAPICQKYYAVHRPWGKACQWSTAQKSCWFQGFCTVDHCPKHHPRSVILHSTFYTVHLHSQTKYMYMFLRIPPLFHKILLEKSQFSVRTRSGAAQRLLEFELLVILSLMWYYAVLCSTT